MRTLAWNLLSVSVAVLLVTTTAAADDLILKNNQPATGGKPAASPSATPRAPVSAPTATPLRPAKAIVVMPRAGESPRAAWDRYFAALKLSEAEDAAAQRELLEFQQDLRQTVRELMAKEKFHDVAAVIEAALVSGHPQPWMYQALGLALEAAKAPPDQLERALMSAVDFAGNEPAQLSLVAHYLARARLDARALKVLRYVSELEPTRPDAYLQGLAVARRLDDLEGIQWATLGILNQAWTNNQKHVFAEAVREADALYERLTKQNRTADALAFRKQVQDALARDLRVKVSWTGDADIDISVQEPTGAICSFRNPRTTGGGVLLGDSFASDKQAALDGYAETYECPRAFNGDYQLMLRRILGRVTANKVTVEIESRDKHGEKISVKKEIELGEGANFLQFAVENGRRTEPLAEAQVAHALREQAALGRQVLAQQLGGVLDPAALAALAASRSALNANANANGALTGILPIPVAGGAVGFRPVITTLPEGANLAATAVISADRRYVRITSLPLFSKIGKVLAFNIITGRITDGNPDVGNNAGGGANAGNAGGANTGGVPR